MPIYDYKCQVCSEKFTRFLKMADSDSQQTCDCGGAATKQITAARIIADYAPYECPVTGKIIEGRRAHEENLKRTGCRIMEPGETEAFKARKQREEAAFEASIDATTEQFIAALPESKKNQLINEVAAGASAEVIKTSL